MTTIARIKLPKPKQRNPYALEASMRSAGPMKKKSMRGGQRNEQRELLDLAAQDDEEQDLVCEMCGKVIPPNYGFYCSKKCCDEAESWANA